MPVRSGSSAVELGEEALVCSEYSAGNVTGTFLSSKIEFWMNDTCSRVSHRNKLPLCKPYVCIAEGVLVSANKRSYGRIKPFLACPGALNLLWLL